MGETVTLQKLPYKYDNAYIVWKRDKSRENYKPGPNTYIYLAVCWQQIA